MREIVQYIIVTFMIFVSVNAPLISNTITLQNKNQYTCLFNDPKLGFLYPPTEHTLNVENFVQDIDWCDDDWNILNTNSLNFGPIQDGRWGGFATNFTKRVSLNLTSSASFSVYDEEKFNLHLLGKRKPKEIHITRNGYKLWSHYTLLKDKKNAFFFENGILIKRTKLVDETTNRLVIEFPNETYFKLHDYTFRTSDQISEQPSVLTIPPTGRSCLMVYTYQCDDCSLTVVNNEKRLIINSTINNNSLLRSWQETKVDIDPTASTKLIFKRENLNQKNESGIWALDMRFCPIIIKENYYVAKFTSNRSNHICYDLDATLNEAEDGNGNANKSQKFCPKPGLGRNCEISCQDVLGEKFPNCERHEICLDSHCGCAWGFRGPLCQKGCDGNTWGIDCETNCADDCVTCDAETGDCVITILVTVLIIILALAAAICFIIFRKYKLFPNCKKLKRKGTKDIEENIGSLKQLTNENENN